MPHAMPPSPAAKVPTPQKTIAPTHFDTYRRLRLKVDAQLAAQQTQDATETLRTIQRLQHLAQIK